MVLFPKEIEILVVGLSGSGKTSLIQALAGEEFRQVVVPTVGFANRKVSRRGLTVKVWDLGGQKRFRSMWHRYAGGVQAILVSSARGRSKLCRVQLVARQRACPQCPSDLTDSFLEDRNTLESLRHERRLALAVRGGRVRPGLIARGQCGAHVADWGGVPARPSHADREQV